MLIIIAVLTFVSALLYRDPARADRGGRRRDLRWLAAALALGIPAQAVVGGLTVLTDLNPYLVGLHLLLSMVLISLAVWLVRLTRGLRPGRSRRRPGPGPGHVPGPALGGRGRSAPCSPAAARTPATPRCPATGWTACC